MGKKGKNFFAFFKNRKMTPKERNEAAMEKARAISDKMAQDKQDSRNLFLEKILENARAYNAAREDFDSEERKEEDK